MRILGILKLLLNDLKKMNDTYGHERGNDAIRKTCSLICDVFAHSPVYRFGGDEFVIFGVSTTEDEVKAKIKKIQEEIQTFNKNGKYSPYILGVSMGYAMIKPDTDKSLFSFIESADRQMYKVKQEKKDARTGKDRRSGRDRRINNRRALNDPINLS